MSILKKIQWRNLRNPELWVLLPLLLAVLLASVVMIKLIENNPELAADGYAASDDVKGDEPDFTDAIQLVNNNDLRGARSLLDLKLKKWPRSANGWSLLGMVNYRMGNYQDAEISFQKMIRFQPQNVTGYHNLSQVLRRMQRFEEALEAALQAAKLAPENGAVLANAASLLARFRRDAEAITFLRQALKYQASPETLAEDSELVRLLEQPEFEAFYRQSRQEEK